MMRVELRLALIVAAISIAGAACSSGTTDSPRMPGPDAGSPPDRAPGPFAITEKREPCARYSVLRSAWFGDLHVHTRLSADAYIYGTRGGPDDAYAFARGGEISVSDDNEVQSRRARIDRSLDFTAVTDHAEFYGEVKVCTDPSSPVYDDALCASLRQADTPADQALVVVYWLARAGVPNPPPGAPFCSNPGVDCKAAAISVWKQIQAAAEAAYDRTSACTFTSFVAYEHTASPGGKHLHRNVIFRNEHVPAHAISYIDTAPDVPTGLWSAIEKECLSAGTGCDALLIPHNSNLSGGQQWLDPVDAGEARRRGQLEPLAELHQQKGNSECRFDRIAGMGVGTTDELCTFEQLPRVDEVSQPPKIDAYPPRAMVRNTLKDGLALEEKLGVNPFKLGFIGSTDTHNATPGNADERGWVGSQGNNDASPERKVADNFYDNPGGLAVVWAEENARDSIFAALRRRETYATSGTRPTLRFFAGTLDQVSCARADLVERAYRTGAPMGGDVGPQPGGASPHFVVLAQKDPGTADVPGTDLQRAQIVKGWVTADEQTHEKVFDVAGDANNGASVDPVTCEPKGKGAAQLCTEWTDPEFKPAERAFYYVRLLENPTCRWSTRVCKSAGVDPFAADCTEQAAAADPRFANCCVTEATDPSVSRLVQERAWSSPIWYRPEAIAGVQGSISFGSAAGKDVIDLDIEIGHLPPTLDLKTTPLTLRVSDDDEIVKFTLPAGSLTADATGRHFTVSKDAAKASGLGSASLDLGTDGTAHLVVQSLSGDLRKAAAIDHFITVSLAAGIYEASHTRLWQRDGNTLSVSG